MRSVLIVLVPMLAAAQSSGYWHTNGNAILDSSNHTVRIAGVNWYGFETTDEVAHGLWAQDYHTILGAIKNNGYNVIRIPLSNQMVETPIIPSNITYTNSSGAVNTDLKGLNSLQILDKIIAAAGSLGLRVILDNHRSEAGNSAEANGLWYTGSYPESAWINDWNTLATRYLNNATVIGIDLRNEPHNATSGGSCWGCGSSTNDWRLAAERAGNSILAINPNVLIFVEGTDCYNGDCDWWGGNLEGAQSYPVVLKVSNRLVYSAHDYGPNLYVQSWFNGSTTYASLVSVWTKYWAYLSLSNVAPVWVGEFGTTNNASDIQNSAAGSQGQWFQDLVQFLKANGNLQWTYWALNGEDSYALLDSNFDPTPASALKQQLLATIQAPGTTGPTCTAKASAPSGLSGSAVSATQINLSWTAVGAPANCSVTYNVYSGSSLVASALTSGSYAATGLQPSTTYTFTVTAVDGAGESAASNQLSVKTPAQVCSSVSAAPAGLVAAAVSTSQINLTWNAVSAPSGCSVSYSVYSGGKAVATGIAVTSYSATGLAVGTSYTFYVTAVDAFGSSASSNQVSATTQSAGGGSACHVTYVVNSQWNNGFNTGLSIQNTGKTTINSWTLTWTWPANEAIYQSWNANYVQSGKSVNLTNASWNPQIGPGATVSGIGFNASYSGTNPSPTAFYVNGQLCR